MRQFLLGLRIRVKLLAAFGSILLLSVLLIFFSFRSISKIISYKGTNEDVDALKLRLDGLDLAYKEFMYEEYKSKAFLAGHKSQAIVRFEDHYKGSKKLIEKIDKGDAKGLLLGLDNLQKDFAILVELLTKRGFRDYGLEGSLREAIHNVENSGFEFDKVDMLMLRRHEKDFFLRKDLKYQGEFNTRFDAFRQKVEMASGIELLSHLDNYKNQFNNIIEIEKLIGLSEKEGIRGRIQNSFSIVHPQIELIRSSIKAQNQNEIAGIQLILLIIFTAQIVAGIVMALLYAALLVKPIKDIRNGMLNLAAGAFPDKLHILSSEEIGQTKLAFNQFIDRLRAATTFAEQLGAGRLESEYDSRYADDVLAKALLNAQEKLRNADEQQRKINWMNEGMVRFNEVTKRDTDDTVSLCDSMLKLIVNYVGANQGAIYIVQHSHGGDHSIERISTYAYDKKKNIEHCFDLGTGLVGQCVLEGEVIYLKDIPRDYVKITSGLGQATPRNVVIVPLKMKNVVTGVLELASFNFLENHHISLLERISESIASILLNKQTASETKRLLEESQQKALALIQQEEEMRQNAEELQATQEEMQRQQSSLRLEIKELRQKIAAKPQLTTAT